VCHQNSVAFAGVPQQARTMIVLAIDTASATCAACLLDSGADRLLASCSEEIGTGHAERLMPMIEELLAQAAISPADLGLIAVSRGPGSFTGLRTGLAAARGFAQALCVPGVGVSTLEAIGCEAAMLAQGRPVRVLIDARRGEAHAQDFSGDFSYGLTSEFEQGEAQIGGPRLLALESVFLAAPGTVFAGTGAVAALAAQVAHGDSASGPGIVLPQASTAAIETYARLGHRRFEAFRDGAITSLTMLPLYVRGADARPQDGFALQRAAPDAKEPAGNPGGTAQ
jgi:tRNA threonylcarbamoyladenosine biosynthesis protein TsaB